MKETLKQELFDFCNTFVTKRIERIHLNIVDIQDALTSETKSSAGDKHETGRAMLHLEREKLGQQLAEAEKMRQALSKVSLKSDSNKIGLGSLVKTQFAQYFIAISAGEFKNAGESIFCISAGTPIGMLLLRKSVGDIINFKGKDIEILEFT